MMSVHTSGFVVMATFDRRGHGGFLGAGGHGALVFIRGARFTGRSRRKLAAFGSACSSWASSSSNRGDRRRLSDLRRRLGVAPIAPAPKLRERQKMVLFEAKNLSKRFGDRVVTKTSRCNSRAGGCRASCCPRPGKSPASTCSRPFRA